MSLSPPLTPDSRKPDCSKVLKPLRPNAFGVPAKPLCVVLQSSQKTQRARAVGSTQRATPWIVRAAPLAVLVYPNAAVGVLAGTCMPPLQFHLLTLVSVGMRALAARRAGFWAAGLVEAALRLLAEWQGVLTIVAAAVALLSVWPFLPSGQTKRGCGRQLAQRHNGTDTLRRSARVRARHT